MIINHEIHHIKDTVVCLSEFLFSFLLFFLGDGSFASLLEKIGGKMSENIFELVLKKFDLHVSSKFIICYFKNKVYLICIWDGFSWIFITFLFTTLWKYRLTVFKNVLKDYDVQKCKGCLQNCLLNICF